MRGIADSPTRARTAAVLAVALLGAAAPATGAEQLYRWVDREGRVHYTQQPPPRGAARSVERKNLSGSVVQTSAASFALQRAMQNYPVTLFTAPECKQGCNEARELLTRRGVPFREVVVSSEETNVALKKATGDNKVPALLVGSVVQIGYLPEALHEALDSAGYPKSPAFTGQPPELPPYPGLPPQAEAARPVSSPEPAARAEAANP